MKQILTLLCWVLLTSVVLAQTDPPEVSISINNSNIAVGDILKEISRQSGLDFSYNAKNIDPKQRIDFKINEANLEETLNQLAASLEIDYILVDDQIVLTLPSVTELMDNVQEYFTISGFLNDKTSGETLIGATVSVRGTNIGSVTNAFGFYSLRLAKGAYALDFSYIGYDLQAIELDLKDDLKQDLVMSPSTFELPDVIVSLPLKLQLQQQSMDQMELPASDLLKLPEFAGATGLIKGMQSLPGIKTNSDGSAFFHVRGGDRDQNLIIIDDAPIYNPSHLFGFYSVVVPDFTKSIKVYKSDLPASMGDRLSSIVNIRTKDGNLNKWEFSGALNPFINRFALEIPIVKQKSSIFTSFRSSNFDWLYKKDNPSAKLGFGDFSFKWNQKLNDNNRLFFTVIAAGDEFTQNTNGFSWGNFASTLRWNHIFGPRLFSNTTIHTGTYLYRTKFEKNKWESGIGSLSIKSDFTHYVNPKYTARFGFEIQSSLVNPGTVSGEKWLEVLPQVGNNNTRKRAFYYQSEYKVNDKFTLSGGLRLLTWENLGKTEYFTYDEQYEIRDTVATNGGSYHTYLNLDPRFNAKLDLSKSSYAQLSYGKYHQYLHLISNSVSPFNFLEIWLPSSPNVKPQEAHQVSLSYLKYLEKSKTQLSISAYYKMAMNQIDYAPHAVTLVNPQLEGELRFGTLRSYGLELFLKKKVGKLNGWLSYTWSRAIRQTPDLNDGKSYPAFQDRPHDFSLMLNYQLSPRVTLSSYWTAYTGSSFSSPTGFYSFQDRTVPIYDEKHNDRLPAYRRLDMAIKFQLNKNPLGKYQHSLNFSVYNILAHKNIVSVNFNKVEKPGGDITIQANYLEEQQRTATQLDMIRFMPSLTYKFKL